MTDYLFIYHGGSHPDSEEEMMQVIQAWRDWVEELGDAVVDEGNPVGKSTTVKPDGSVEEHGGSNPAAGYGIFRAESLEQAIAMAKSCPHVAAGGSIELADIHQV